MFHNTCQGTANCGLLSPPATPASGNGELGVGILTRKPAIIRELPAYRAKHGAGRRGFARDPQKTRISTNWTDYTDFFNNP